MVCSARYKKPFGTPITGTASVSIARSTISLPTGDGWPPTLPHAPPALSNWSARPALTSSVPATPPEQAWAVSNSSNPPPASSTLWCGANLSPPPSQLPSSHMTTHAVRSPTATSNSPHPLHTWTSSPTPPTSHTPQLTSSLTTHLRWHGRSEPPRPPLVPPRISSGCRPSTAATTATTHATATSPAWSTPWLTPRPEHGTSPTHNSLPILTPPIRSPYHGSYVPCLRR